MNRYAWPGTSFIEWCDKHPSEVKYSSRAKCRREYWNRVLHYARTLGGLQEATHTIRARWEDDFTAAIKTPSLLTTLMAKTTYHGGFVATVEVPPQYVYKQPYRGGIKYLLGVARSHTDC
jgi:hypothetical protein